MSTEEVTGVSLRALVEQESRSLSELAPRVPFFKGEEIGVQGQPCENLYILTEGQVLLSRRNTGGENQALYLLGAGDLFGEGSLRPDARWLVTARVIEDGAAHVLPAAQLPRFAQYYPHVTAQVISLLGARLERCHRRLDLVTTDSARTRILGLLTVMAEHHGQARGGELWLPVRLTQAELGAMVGLARETVTRILAELEAEGAILRRGRQGLWLRELLHVEPEHDFT